MNDIKPIWTNDWACQHYKNWMKFLGKFVGVEAHGLEIGSCEGRSSCFFVQNILAHQKSTLTCVDPFYMGTEQIFWHNVDALGCRSKINQVKQMSDNVNLSAQQWDFVYVDGCHSAPATMKDAVRSWVSLKKNGVLIFDDVIWHLSTKPAIDRPKLAIDSFLAVFEKELNILHYGAQAIIEKLV